MTLDEAINFFGNAAKLCKALGIPRQSVSRWRRADKDYIPPKHQLKLQRLTGNLLKASLEDGD